MGMSTKQRRIHAQRKITKVAAGLVTAPWGSEFAEDWPKRPSGRQVARQMEKDAERRRQMAIELAKVLDLLRAEESSGPAVDPDPHPHWDPPPSGRAGGRR